MQIIFKILIIIFLFNSTLKSQVFNATEISTDEFPKVKTTVITKDRADKNIGDLTKNDFTVTENGRLIPNAELNLTCRDVTEKPELAIVLAIDRTGSMGVKIADDRNDTRWDWVKKGVETFLNSLEFVGRTKVAIIAFSNTSTIVCDFSNDVQELLDSLDQVIVQGPTKYDPPYIKKEGRESIVNLLKDCPPELRRISIFLTDGLPDTEPSTKDIIDSLNFYSITGYNITFFEKMYPALNTISVSTGGRSFQVLNEEDLDAIYTAIAIEAQEASFCELSWIAKYACSAAEVNREVEIKFTRFSPNITNLRTYKVPDEGIAIRDLSSKTLSFGDPEVGPNFSVEKTLEIGITRAPFRANNISIIPNNQGFSFKGIFVDDQPYNYGDIINVGSIIKVNVEFEQFDSKTLRRATLIVEGQECEPIAELVGGTVSVFLESQNDGEVYTTCDNIEVLWSGVQNNTPVHISYSSDNFNNDSNYIATRTGLSYNWNNTPAPGDYKLKLRVDPTENYLWAKSIATGTDIYARSIALSNNEVFSYVVGNYNNTATFEDTTISSRGGKDIFLAKYNAAGKLLWVNSLGGDAIDTASAVCVDNTDNIYFTGSIRKTARFGSTNINIPFEGLPYFFISKTSPDGGNYVTRIIGAQDIYVDFEIWGNAIRFNEATGLIEVRGEYRNTRNGVNTQSGSRNFQGDGSRRRFTAFYDKDLNLVDIQMSYLGGVFSSNEVTTEDGKNTYKVDTFTNDISFGPFNLKHDRQTDSYIFRYGQNEESTAISEIPFKIEKPILDFDNTGPIDFGDVAYGVNQDLTSPKLLITRSLLPIEIDSFNITGPNANDFSLDQNLAGLIVESGIANAQDVIFRFTPSDMGVRIATLNVFGHCADPISIQLQGNGICDLSSSNILEFGNSNLNKPKTILFEDVFINNNDASVRIRPEITNDPLSEFEIISINGDPGLVGQIITVLGLESINVQISFTPKETGLREAKLSYSAETQGCADITSDLNGIGIESSIDYSSVSFEKKRINTVNTLELVITNNGSLSEEIENIWVEENDIFEIILPNDLSIASGESISATLIFTPLADAEYEETIYLKLVTSENVLDLATVRGIGTNPTAIASLDCPPSPPQTGKLEIVNLRIENQSSYEETVLENIQINAASDFTFMDNSKEINVTQIIGENEFIDIPVQFLPTGSGNRNVVFRLTSRTNVGNNVDEEVLDPINRNNEFSCFAVPGDGVRDVNFGNILACHEDVISEIIPNTTGSLITLLNHQITGMDAIYFNTNIVDGTIFDTDYAFDIIFAPDVEKSYMATLTVTVEENNVQTTYQFDLTGEGKDIKINSAEEQIVGQPGISTRITILAEIPELKYDVESLDIRIGFNETMISFLNNINIYPDVISNINWTWNTPIEIGNNNNLISIVGSSNDNFSGLNNQNVQLFETSFFSFLGNTLISSIFAHDYIDNCPNPIEEIATVQIDSICTDDIRLIDVSNLNRAIIKPKSNIVSNQLEVEYSVMFNNTFAKIYLMNYLGQIEKVFVEEIKSEGWHEDSYSLDNISSGMYNLIYESGNRRNSKKIIISK